MSVENILKILFCLIDAIIILCSAYLVPFLKSKLTAEKYNTLCNYISSAVRCAEQLYSDNLLKKNFVLNYITRVINNKLNIDMSEDDLNVLIESIVCEVKHCNSDGSLISKNESEE